MLQRMVSRIVARAGTMADGGPIMWPGDRQQAARRARNASEWTFEHDPRWFAYSLGLRVGKSAHVPCGGEVTGFGVVVYQDTSDRQDRGLRVYHGIAHALLEREDWTHTEADAWLLTLELAIPPSALREHGIEHVRRVAHAPAWAVDLWAPFARGSALPLSQQMAATRSTNRTTGSAEDCSCGGDPARHPCGRASSTGSRGPCTAGIALAKASR
jgi:hypothetical protein